MSNQSTDWEHIILNRFVEGKTIVQLPAKQKKRKVVLKWLSEQIPSGTKISHEDFNRLLRRHYPDTAMLRRELFEFGYVHRDRESYWRDAT